MVHRPPGLVRKCGKASRLFQTSVGIHVFWIPTEVSFSTGLFSFFLVLFLSFRGAHRSAATAARCWVFFLSLLFFASFNQGIDQMGCGREQNAVATPARFHAEGRGGVCFSRTVFPE